MSRLQWLGLFLLTLVLTAPVSHLCGAEHVFWPGGLGTSPRILEWIRQGTLPELAKLGFAEGRNLVLDERDGNADVLGRLAQELVQDKPDAIVPIGSPAVRAASEATSTIPI